MSEAGIYGIIFDMEKMDLTSLKKAVLTLEEVLVVYKNDRNNAIIRDSLIKRFEYTYAVALKMIRRYFKITAFTLDVDNMTFNQMIREADRLGLLPTNLEKWTVYREKRNMTSHMYLDNAVNDLADVVADFYKDAVFLLNRLEEKTNE